MVDIKIMLKGMLTIKSVFPKFEISQEKAEMWNELFSDITNEEYKYAVKKELRTTRFMPTVGSIRGHLTSLEKTAEEFARDFESILFKHDTDITIKHFKQKGDEIAVKVLENNYKQLRELKNSEKSIFQAQLRQQYISYKNVKIKELELEENPFLLGEIKNIKEMKQIT